MRSYLVPLLLLALTGCASSAPDTAAPSTTDTTARLETTPRHDEWARVDRGGRTLHLYVSYPQVSSKAPAVLLIHENRGLTDWVRSVADALSEKGFIAVAPDFLSGMAPGGGKTSDFASQDAAREAISALPRDQVLGDLDTALAFVRAIPAASGEVSVAGFCWGGARAWDFANRARGLDATYVFYGTGPSQRAEVASIDAPVYGFYGGNDARVNATIEATAAAMREEGNSFEPVIYPGAGHAFMREGELPTATAENRKARDEAWVRWLGLLRRH
jgi:carboxymethylenebutenolidase